MPITPTAVLREYYADVLPTNVHNNVRLTNVHKTNRPNIFKSVSVVIFPTWWRELEPLQRGGKKRAGAGRAAHAMAYKIQKWVHKNRARVVFKHGTRCELENS